MNYRGRFAPSPSGPLHLGSLVAAVGSYIRARIHDGVWLIRIEDIDPPREEPGASEHIINTLAAHGMVPDEAILFQSSRLAAYQSVVDDLIARGEAYWCNCSRKSIRARQRNPSGPLIYPGVCREKHLSGGEGQSLRLKTHDRSIVFTDAYAGQQAQNVLRETGDFVLKRADGFFSYQLAVVVDDEYQGITEVVRGQDLTDNTPRQIHLQRVLGYHTPDYLHLPLVFNRAGQKLSKQNHAAPVEPSMAIDNLIQAFELLGYPSTPDSYQHSPQELLGWAIEQEHISPRLIRRHQT